MLSRKAHLQQLCWPRPIDFLMALREDFFEYHRSERAVILPPVWQKVTADSVPVSQRVRVDSVHLDEIHPRALHHHQKDARPRDEQKDQPAGTACQREKQQGQNQPTYVSSFLIPSPHV